MANRSAQAGLLGSLAGGLADDGRVDGADVPTLQPRWPADPNAADNAIYDVNGDGRIDGLDA